jgi:hypothetical protein
VRRLIRLPSQAFACSRDRLGGYGAPLTVRALSGMRITSIWLSPPGSNAFT